MNDVPKAATEKLSIPLASALVLGESGIIKSSSDDYSSSESLYIINTDLKDGEGISKFYENSLYSKYLPIENMAIPVQILGQEIKQSFVFPNITSSPSLITLKNIEKEYFEDYRWQVVRLIIKIGCI